MDYRLNNEGIVACVATQVVCCGFRKVSEVVAVTNLLMHEDMRKEVKNMVSNKNLGAIMNRIDGGLLTITMNSLALMVMGGCRRYDDGKLTLTHAGENLCMQIKDGRCHKLNQILKDIPNIIRKIETMGGINLDNRYIITA